MKNAAIIILSISMVFLLLSCSKESDKKDSYLEIAIAGPDLNRDYKITSPHLDEDLKATGLIYPEGDGKPEVALITFQDQQQQLSATLTVPTKKQLIEMLWDEVYSMSFTDHNEQVIMASKTVSMNISKFNKKGPSILPFLQTMDVEGNFEGVMAYKDEFDREVTHIVSGRFKFYNHK